ncbi:MAG: antirestriction protein ArdA [Anaerolineae bacterium]|nr:antirestriction protein ArdA [Anaerolineae bacterium]
MTNDETTPRIYVACLAAYNNGKLHGAWIDATQEPDAIWEEVQAMLKASPKPGAEEWAIHDHEGFAGIRLSEWTSFERVHELAQFISEYGDLGAQVLAHYGDNVKEARTALTDRYRGQYRSLEEYAEELTTDISPIPDHLIHYIDYEAMARDMELNGDVFTVETGCEEVHVFWAY